LNCLNKENKAFQILTFSLYLIFFSSSLLFFFIFFFSCFMPRIVTRGVLDVSLLVRQLKHMGFIYNALNCLNEENKSFSNSLFRSPSLSNFLFISLTLPKNPSPHQEELQEEGRSRSSLLPFHDSSAVSSL
jgi:hypothetical protein